MSYENKDNVKKNFKDKKNDFKSKKKYQKNDDYQDDCSIKKTKFNKKKDDETFYTEFQYSYEFEKDRQREKYNKKKEKHKKRRDWRDEED